MRFCAKFEIHESVDCLAKVAMPSFKRTIVAGTTFDAIFIGYTENSAAYRFMRLDDKFVCEA